MWTLWYSPPFTSVMCLLCVVGKPTQVVIHYVARIYHQISIRYHLPHDSMLVCSLLILQEVYLLVLSHLDDLTRDCQKIWIVTISFGPFILFVFTVQQYVTFTWRPQVNNLEAFRRDCFRSRKAHLTSCIISMKIKAERARYDEKQKTYVYLVILSAFG